MCSLVEDKPEHPDEPPSHQSGGIKMKRKMFSFALVIALALGASARSEARNCSPLAGSYGYAMSGLFLALLALLMSAQLRSTAMARWAVLK